MITYSASLRILLDARLLPGRRRRTDRVGLVMLGKNGGNGCICARACHVPQRPEADTKPPPPPPPPAPPPLSDPIISHKGFLQRIEGKLRAEIGGAAAAVVVGGGGVAVRSFRESCLYVVGS